MSKTHKITQLKKRIAELEKKLKQEQCRRNVETFCSDVQFRQSKRELHPYWGRLVLGDIADTNTDAGFKDIVAGAIEVAVLTEPDFIKNYVSVTRSDEPDRYGNYTYQWEITFATKEV